MPAKSKRFQGDGHPLVVGTIHTARGLDAAGGLEGSDLDLLEFRADLVRRRLLPEALEALPVPVIGTVRARDEGGTADPAPAARKPLFRKMLPAVHAIDLEQRHADGFTDLIEEAHGAGIEVIFSFHDFKRTPPLEQLRLKARQAADAGATIFKVATQVNSPADLAELLLLLGDRDLPPLAVMGMGSLGRVSRLVLAAAGSLLNYGWLDCPQVVGQWPALVFRYRLHEALSEG